jgi:hypothetical protein
MQAVAARLHQLHAPGPENSGAAAALELLNLVNEKGRELAHQASCGYQVDAAEVERLHLALREAHSSLESLNGTTSAEWSLANQEVARQRLQAEVQRQNKRILSTDNSPRLTAWSSSSATRVSYCREPQASRTAAVRAKKRANAGARSSSGAWIHAQAPSLPAGRSDPPASIRRTQCQAMGESPHMGSLPRSQSAALPRNVPRRSRGAATSTAAAFGLSPATTAELPQANATVEPPQETARSEDGLGTPIVQPHMRRSSSREVGGVQSVTGGARRQADGSVADPGGKHEGSESKAKRGGGKHGGRGPTSGTRDGPSGTESGRRGEEPEDMSKGAGEGNASLSHISSADFVPQISPAALQTQLADEMLAKQDQVAQALRPGKLHMTNLERMFAHLGSGVREVERQEASAAYKKTQVWVPPLTEANLVPGLQPHYLNMLHESSSYNSQPKLATVGGYVKSSTAIQKALYKAVEEAAAKRKMDGS